MAEDFALGNELFVDEKYTEALTAFTRAVETEPQNVKYFLQRSATFHALKKYQDALNDAVTAIELDSRNALAYFRKGLALFEVSDVQNAYKVLQDGKQLETGPTAKFDKWLKKCEEKMASLKDVEAKALKLKAQGNEKFKQRNYKKAVEFYSEAVQLQIPNEPKSLILGNMANALHKLGNHKECLQAATTATELNPTWKKGQYWKGMSLFYLKDPEAAKRAFEAGLLLDPTDEDFRAKVDTIQYCQDHSADLESVSSEDQLNIYQSVQKNMTFIKTDSFAKDIMRLSRRGKDKVHGTQPTIVDHMGALLLTDVPINALTEKDMLIQRKLKSAEMHKVYMSVIVDTKTGAQTVIFQDTPGLNQIQSLVLRLTAAEASKSMFNEHLAKYT